MIARPPQEVTQLLHAWQRGNGTALDRLIPKVVELRFFGGMTKEETAEALQVSSDTVLHDWKKAKPWLWGEMTHGRGSDS